MNYARFVFSSPTFAEQQREALNNFQGASAVGGEVKELKDRVRNLMTIIVNHVKSQNHVEGNKTTIANAMKRMEGDSRELLRFVL